MNIEVLTYVNLGLIFILFVLFFKAVKKEPKNGNDGKDGIGVEYYKEGIRIKNKKGETVIEYEKPLKK